MRLSRRESALAGATIFLSAFLLFQVQPLMAKLVLPWFGGTAAVWATCLVFFQSTLLAGYLYTHGAVLRLSPRAQRVLHAVLLLACVAVLPIGLVERWKPGGTGNPVLGILGLLAAGVGLPYLALATTGPLVQAWLVQARPGVTPYRLFALSNLGSMIALVTYPVLVEPYLTLQEQRWLWSAAFLVFAALSTAVGWATRSREAEAPQRDEAGPGAESLVRRLAWLLLAAVPSMLLVAFTTYMIQDVASIPFLWVLPLALYLLSFILCFDAPRWYRRPAFLVATGPVLAGAAYLIWNEAERKPGQLAMIALLAAALFALCMFCHGELARSRPHPRHLTGYYLMISAGGALGGAFVGLAAPAWFPAQYELPIALGLAGFLLTTVLVRWLPGEMLGWTKLAVMVGFATFAGFLVRVGRDFTVDSAVAVRSFYGELRVKDYDELGEEGERYRILVHGTINHGEQYLNPVLRRKLAHYYCADSGIGRLMEARAPGRPQKVGVLGLGAGAMAAFGRAGDEFRFYEINPQVAQLARSQFTYLADSAARVQVTIGDGRLSLEREPAQGFDVLMMDAFSGDSIPLHLLTQQAIELYVRHLKPDGVLVIHITNQNVNLEPVVAAAARALRLEARLIESQGDDWQHCYKTRYALLTRDAARFRHLALSGVVRPPVLPSGFRVWTDDYSNLLRVIK